MDYLTHDDEVEADYVADQRFADAYLSKLPDRHGLKRTTQATEHTLGARGEMIVKRFLGYPGPLTVNTFKEGGDIGHIHVRTRSRHSYQLILRDDDPDGIYVLVTTDDNKGFRVRGWLTAAEIREHDPEWRRGYGGRVLSLFPPNEMLHPMRRGEVKYDGDWL